jgi:hypothetical protein
MIELVILFEVDRPALAMGLAYSACDLSILKMSKPNIETAQGLSCALHRNERDCEESDLEEERRSETADQCSQTNLQTDFHKAIWWEGAYTTSRKTRTV